MGTHPLRELPEDGQSARVKDPVLWQEYHKEKVDKGVHIQG